MRTATWHKPDGALHSLEAGSRRRRGGFFPGSRATETGDVSTRSCARCVGIWAGGACCHEREHARGSMREGACAHPVQPVPTRVRAQLLAELPEGAEDACKKVQTAYRRKRHVVHSLKLVLQSKADEVTARQPNEATALHSAAGFSTLHAQLVKASLALKEAQGVRSRLPTCTAAAERVQMLTRALWRLRGAVTFTRDLVEYPAMLQPWSPRHGAGRPASAALSSGARALWDSDGEMFVGSEVPASMIAAEDLLRRLSLLRPMEAHVSQMMLQASYAYARAVTNTVEAHTDIASAQPGASRPRLVARSSVITDSLLGEVEGQDGASRTAGLRLHASVDGSAAGPLAGRVHRCEGALDEVAELEARLCRRLELASISAMVSHSQHCTLLAMKEVRVGPLRMCLYAIVDAWSPTRPVRRCCLRAGARRVRSCGSGAREERGHRRTPRGGHPPLHAAVHSRRCTQVPAADLEVCPG